ncbi:MAG TPA: transglutaminase family protein [Ktedonobacteraceae bacterium]|nr:transglutaminase family protein [Ktedonobacteraceae bacterium]
MNQGPAHLETMITTLNLLDHRTVDWKRVQRTAYLIHQHFRYEYPGPIEDLKQCLMIIPPDNHGDQRLVLHHLSVSEPTFELSRQSDSFGNTVLNLSIPRVEKSIDFEASIVVERRAGQGPHRIPAAWLSDPRFLEPSPLTQPDDTLRGVAATLMAEGHQGRALAQRINDWVYHALRYAHGITDVRTPAAEALALGQGVCQDYAHIMIALCRLCGLPARYVSGHLLGEGGTHAWVEVLLPSADQPTEAIALPFDPTHGCEASLSYITIAVGRDYFDVAPTSGTFRASYRGRLSARKRVGLTELEYKDTA